MKMNPPDDFSLDLFSYYLAKKYKMKIIRFPVFFPKRIYGESNWNTSLPNKWKFIKRTIRFTSKMKRNLRKTAATNVSKAGNAAKEQQHRRGKQ